MYGKKRKILTADRDELLWKELSESSQSEQFSQSSQQFSQGSQQLSQSEELDKDDTGESAKTTPMIATQRSRQLIASSSRIPRSKQSKPVVKKEKSTQPVLTQMFLDAGQKSIGSIRCTICGMVYYPGQLAGIL